MKPVLPVAGGLTAIILRRGGAEAGAARARLFRSLRPRVGREDVGEVPGVLDDAGAGVRVGHAWTAAVVALDRPDRQRVDAVRPGEVLEPLRIGRVGDLGLAR